MRAAVITQFNKPWELKELPDPKPAPGQVVVRVHASGLCYTDLHAHHGHFPLKPPFVAGHEPAGTIIELGPGVTDFKVGDRVGVCWHQKGCGRCEPCQSGRQDHCANVQSWMNLGGSNAERMLAWAAGCTLIPDNVSFELAAPLFCAGFTVMSGLRNADLEPGERVAVLGVGGLGHLALQFSKALGLETFAVTGQENKRKELLGLGADEVVLAGDDPGAALTKAGGADVILSTTNSAKQIAQAFSGLRVNGRMINMGVADGPIQLNPMAFFGQRQLRGSQQDERSDLVEALTLVSRGKVKPIIETYPLERANEAVQRLEQSKVRYRAVLQHVTS
jgi:D-arabinose 1-dehydrogenase-like Zn-dependent alcohol dehydrogenase